MVTSHCGPTHTKKPCLNSVKVAVLNRILDNTAVMCHSLSHSSKDVALHISFAKTTENWLATKREGSRVLEKTYNRFSGWLRFRFFADARSTWVNDLVFFIEGHSGVLPLPFGPLNIQVSLFYGEGGDALVMGGVELSEVLPKEPNKLIHNYLWELRQKSENS